MKAIDEGSDERTKQRVQDGYSGKGNGEIYESRCTLFEVADTSVPLLHIARRTVGVHAG